MLGVVLLSLSSRNVTTHHHYQLAPALRRLKSVPVEVCK